MSRLLLVVLVLLPMGAKAQCEVRGRVVDAHGPVPAALVRVDDRTTHTDDRGAFLLGIACRRATLAVELQGGEVLRTPLDPAGGTVELGELRIPENATALEEMVVTGTMREVGRSQSPVPVEVITPMFLRRNPSPVLFDAVGQVNGVRPQINCSICNTGDIHINGMEGPYTMVLIDGMPIVSGLSTVYGLSGIPTSLVERIEIMKGPGSALYGSEAMGGIINVITKDPLLAPLASVDLMSTSWGEHNVDVGLRMGTGKVNGLLGVSAFQYDRPMDRNGDGFTDATLQERVSVFGKVALRRPDRRSASLAARLVMEDRWGGQMEWTPAFTGGDSVYGETIATNRFELIGQYQLPVRERIVANFSFNRHDQRSWYGTTPFNADQSVFFTQLHWARRVAGVHEVLSGLAYRLTYYNDNTVGTSASTDGVITDAPLRKPLPGFFLQDEWSIDDRHVLLGGFRSDMDMDHGMVHSPRLAWKYAPSGRFAVRANFGTGYRVVDLFTEDHAALSGSRTVVILEDLRPERSWNGTLNVVRKWLSEKRSLGVDASVFHTRFSNRILPDYAVQDLIVYRNLKGFGIAQGASLNMETRVGEYWRSVIGATYMDVYTRTDGDERRQPFAPTWSGAFTVSYERKSFIGLDLTGQWYGPMVLPVQPNDPRPSRSPWYALVNMQVKRDFGRFQLYGGVKNLLDFVPADPLLRPFDPFDKHVDDPVGNPGGNTFDTAYMYAPLQGQRFYLGLRFEFNGTAEQ